MFAAAATSLRPTTTVTDDGTNYSLFERLHEELERLPESFEDLSSLSTIQEMMRHYDMNLKILVTGKVGNGKSTLVNALTGSRDAEEGGLSTERCTKEVNCYMRNANGVNIEIYDSPGLQDESQQKNVRYIEMMQRACRGYDLSLFCISMTETRLLKTSHDIITMKALTTAFGEEYWKRTVIVLTLANSIPQATTTENVEEKNEIFEREYEDWKTKIKEVLTKQVELPSSIADNVPIIPAGHYKMKHLFNQQYWLGNLWLQCFLRLDESAAAAMLVANASRLTSPDRAIVSSDRGPEGQHLAIPKKGIREYVMYWLQKMRDGAQMMSWENLRSKWNEWWHS